MKSIFKILAKALSVTISIVLFISLVSLLCMVIITHTTGEAKLFGYQLVTVHSGSMEPAIKTGSVILVKEVEDPSALQVGDVITFYQSFDRIVTHRIVEVIQSGDEVLYRTKGDNNENPDMTLALADNVLAKYTGITVPYMGYVAKYVNTQVGLILLLVVPGIILLVYSIHLIYQASKELRQHKDASITSASQPGKQEEETPLVHSIRVD